MNRGRHKKRNKNNFCTLPVLCCFIKQNLEILLKHARNTYFLNLCTNSDYFAIAYYSISDETWWPIISYHIYDSYYIDNFIRTVKQKIRFFEKGTIYYLKFRFGQNEHIIKYKVQ